MGRVGASTGFFDRCLFLGLQPAIVLLAVLFGSFRCVGGSSGRFTCWGQARPVYGFVFVAPRQADRAAAAKAAAYAGEGPPDLDVP